MTEIIEKCWGEFPFWDFERQDPEIHFWIPEVCQTCDLINACAINALMQVAKADEHMLDRDEAIALSKASDMNISRLSPTHDQITSLIGERITAKAWGNERISEWMSNLAAMIESIGSDKQ